MYIHDIDSRNPDKILVQLSQATLDDLVYRLRHTRWPDQVENLDWAYGTNREYLQDLLARWADGFDWSAQQAWLNSFEHYRSNAGGLILHYIHARSKDPSATPLLLLHGWPGSFVQMLKLVPLLTNPAEHGMPDAPAFHVVVASLPGFGFSDSFARAGQGMEAIARHMSVLMHDVLGYKKYGVRGSDLGGTTIDQMARHYPEQILGAHLTQLIVAGAISLPGDASDAERSFLDRCAVLANTELSYARQHASKPQTLAYALTDSPAGLAAWIVEKYRTWGDTGGDIESRFNRDFLLTTLTLYWAAESISPAIRTYYDMVRNRGNTDRISVPVGFLMSRHDMFPPAPEEWAQRSHNVVHYEVAQSGGHFLEWEEPELVARDLQAFFRRLVV